MTGKHIRDDELFVIESGARHRAAMYTCAWCGQDFASRRHGSKQPPKYCGQKCAGEAIGAFRLANPLPHPDAEKEQDFTCDVCGEIYQRKPSRNRSQKGVLTCSPKCRYDAAKPENGFCGDSVSPRHYGKLAGRVMDWICACCGLDTRLFLQIHHIDGDRDNNPIDCSNWEVLCANCHKTRHLYQKPDGSWRYRTASITPRDKLVEIRNQVLTPLGQHGLAPTEEGLIPRFERTGALNAARD